MPGAGQRLCHSAAASPLFAPAIATELGARGAAAATSGAALGAFHPNAHGGALNRAPRASLQPTANNMQRLEARVNVGQVSSRWGLLQGSSSSGYMLYAGYMESCRLHGQVQVLAVWPALKGAGGCLGLLHILADWAEQGVKQGFGAGPLAPLHPAGRGST